jgi:hypothetical protein
MRRSILYLRVGERSVRGNDIAGMDDLMKVSIRQLSCYNTI